MKQPQLRPLAAAKHRLFIDAEKALSHAEKLLDEGAAIMGLGHSLMEQLLLDDHGRIRNLGVPRRGRDPCRQRSLA